MLSPRSRLDAALILFGVAAVPLSIVILAATHAEPSASDRGGALPTATQRVEALPSSSPADEVEAVQAKARPRVTVPRPNGRPTRVLLVGDSLRDGYAAIKYSQSWGPTLIRQLNQRHPTVEEKPTAMRGGRRRARSVVALPKGADLTIVEMGTNDYGMTPIEAFTRDYARLIRLVRSASPNTKLLCLSIWQDWRLRSGRDRPTGVGPSIYNDAIRRLCKGGRYVFISDIFNVRSYRGPSGVKTFFLGKRSDEFHPNNDGHAAIARAVAAQLK